MFGTSGMPSFDAWTAYARGEYADASVLKDDLVLDANSTIEQINAFFDGLQSLYGDFNSFQGGKYKGQYYDHDEYDQLMSDLAADRSLMLENAALLKDYADVYGYTSVAHATKLTGDRAINSQYTTRVDSTNEQTALGKLFTEYAINSGLVEGYADLQSWATDSSIKKSVNGAKMSAAEAAAYYINSFYNGLGDWIAANTADLSESQINELYSLNFDSLTGRQWHQLMEGDYWNLSTFATSSFSTSSWSQNSNLIKGNLTKYGVPQAADYVDSQLQDLTAA